MTQTREQAVLILGADGFIGRHLAFHFRDQGYRILCVARRTARLREMGFEVVRVDLAQPDCHHAAFWKPHVRAHPLVVNAAGLLTGSKAAFDAVHRLAPAAIYAALPENGRAVLISAVGVEADTRFAHYRRLGEEVAAQAAVDVVILRPGLVLAETSYGGSSLVRALAAFPGVLPVVGTGTQAFNPVHIDDLTAVIQELLEGAAPCGPYEIGGPQNVTQIGLIRAYRRWLGLSPRPVLRLPKRIALAIGRVGDALKMAPISVTSVRQMQAGVVADPALSPPHHVDIKPFSKMLERRPAATQDLWQARLYLLRPLIRLTLAGMWLVSGALGLLLAPSDWVGALGLTSVPPAILDGLARFGGIVDLVIAFALLRRWRPKWTAFAQIGVVLAYSLGLSVMAPALWLLPLGGLLKNLPVLALILVWMILEDER